MIIVDTALAQREAQGRPIRVAVVGAGFMGGAIARQIVRHVPGMQVAVLANRHVDKAEAVMRDAGVADVRRVDGAGVADAVAAGVPTVTDDAVAACRADGVDAVVEATGTVEHAAACVLEAVTAGKHVVLMNAEVDATIGPVLKTYADRAGVVYTGADGDQPGVELNLYRFVRSLGLEPLVCGNIKGLHDPYRNPTTQQGFARRWGQDARMVTSFADGTKISFEQAVVANATGMGIARRGMTGAAWAAHIDGAVALYDVDELRATGGVVDYVVGAQPSPGVYVFAAEDDAFQRHYLELYKLGTGPLYSFYTPYHLCHLEAPLSVARAVLFGDAAIGPIAGPVVDVVATAKIDLHAGDVLDGIGGYCLYGQCETAAVAAAQRLLPMGVAAGCRLRRDAPRDAVLTYDDVDVPHGRLVDRLRDEQAAAFRAGR